jgi:hypothetical protein
MCWNQDISINTFLFACLALLFIFFTNTFTKYKTKTFDNRLVYLFFLEVAAMQLIEFFLWRNLKNKSLNKLFSQIASVVVFIQPLTLMLMIPNIIIKFVIILLYLIFVIAYYVYRGIYNPIIFHTSIGTNGHLSWEWMNYKGYENMFSFIYLLFFVTSLLFIKNTLLSLFVLISLIISLFFYYKYNTFATMWCWSFNLFLLYFIIDILIIKPFYEYNGLC